MASADVLPWLVGLPAGDTVWDAAPKPTLDKDNATSIAGSPKSEPGTLRSRVQDTTEGTVNIRAQSSSPIKQQSLAWKKRLINGQTSYGDQTSLFGPSGLENIFARTDTGPEKKNRNMGLKGRLSMDQRAENTNPSAENRRPILDPPMPSSPPFAHSPNDKRSSEASPEGSPASQSSQSSLADMLSDMMGKIDELSDSNKGYHNRMQALKESLGDSEESRQKLERSESDEQDAGGSVLRQQGRPDRSSAEPSKSPRQLFSFANQTISAEQRADWAESDRRQLEEKYNIAKRAPGRSRQKADDPKEKYEDVGSELESLGLSSPKSAVGETQAESPKSEIISRQAREPAAEISDSFLSGPADNQDNQDSDPEIYHTEAGAERDTSSKRHTSYPSAHLASDTRSASINRSATDSELEDLTPVIIEKRTTSTGKVSFNAVRSDNAARTNIFKQRKDIDKTETSQRAREAELATGAGDSETNDNEQSTSNFTKGPNQFTGLTDTSVAGGDEDSEWMGARHVSGFTDAPEVEEDMPVSVKEAEFSSNWDFSEPPQNESSELAAAHRRSENENKRSVSFGLRELDDYAFSMADQKLKDATDATVPETDGAQSPASTGSVRRGPTSRDSSPASDIQAPGSRAPFEFRKESLSEIHCMSPKSKRLAPRTSVSESTKTTNLSLPKTRSSPVPASPEQVDYFTGLTDSRSPPQVYIEDTDGYYEMSSAMESKRPLPRSPLLSPTPKRRRTLHNSELQSVSDATVSYHSQLQEVLSGGKRKGADDGEQQSVAKPSVLAKRKMARPRNASPIQGPATKDYIIEAKKVIELLRTNATPSSILGAITEADENDETYEEYEDEGEEEEDTRYGTYNTHKSDNMRTLAPQQVAHLIGGEMHGMTYDRTKNCWIRSKSFEHKQFLDPRDALSSDDDPFREISDLTVEKSVRVHVTHPSGEMGATTVVHHEFDDETGVSYDGTGLESDADREDTPQQSENTLHKNPKLPGDETTLAHYDDAHESDPSQSSPTIELSTPAPLPPQMTFPSPPNRAMPIEVARLQLASTNPNANINNTFLLSDLPEFSVHQEDHERPSERALASRLASYAAVEVSDPFTVATTELVKAITDVQGRDIHWDDLTTLCLHDRSLKSLHNLEEHCARVEKLDVSANALTQLDGVPQFVRQLNAQSNKLVSLTSWTHLMHLQYLDISSNSLESLDGLGHLIHLRELRVDNNRIRRLDGIADLDGLITLSARKNAIRDVNFEYFRFGRVVELDISDNEITSVQGLEALSSLRTLKLDNNQLGGSFKVTTPMPRLKHLSLRACGLESLDVTHFSNLRTLELDNNRLSSITGLGKLKKLDLLSMCAQDLPEGGRIEIFQRPIEAQTIRLSRNTIPDLQLDHAFMTVKHLSLADTGLASLPSNFGIQFPNLRSLDLSYNGLKDIRPLAALSALETLVLTGCRVERLRKTVATLGKLEKLRKLDMKNNPLTQGFYGPAGDGSGDRACEDRVYKGKLDEDTAMRRRTYELLIAYSCCPREGFELDGLVFDREGAVAKDGVWERLVELGVLRRV